MRQALSQRQEVALQATWAERRKASTEGAKPVPVGVQPERLPEHKEGGEGRYTEPKEPRPLQRTGGDDRAEPRGTAAFSSWQVDHVRPRCLAALYQWRTGTPQR